MCARKMFFIQYAFTIRLIQKYFVKIQSSITNYLSSLQNLCKRSCQMGKTYYVTVAVIRKGTNEGMSGVKVKMYGQEPVKTGGDGKATVSSSNVFDSIYVEGTTVYDGDLSCAPKPIIYEKG